MLHEKVPSQTQGFARIAVYGSRFWHIAKDPLDTVTEVPFEYFSPIGVMRLVPQPVWPLIYTTDEVLSPLCLFYKGFRRIWIVVMFAFHVVTGLFMQIWFTANFLLILFEGELSAETAYRGLMDAGYATRWLPGQGLAQGLRITIGTEDQTRDIARLLRNMAEGRD